MAMPMLAGPGAIALRSCCLNARAQGIEESMVILGAFAAVMVLTLVALMTAAPLMRLAGKRFEAVITRLLGVLLAALAAQFVINGVRGSFGI